jgi:adenylate cyclase
VNLAARLESHTKIVGCEILIDNDTRRTLDKALALRTIRQVQFKGISDPLDVYSVEPPRDQ